MENTTEITTEQQEQQSTEAQTQVAEKVVPVEQLNRVLGDMHKYKKMANETGAKLREFEERALKEKEDFKTLAERYKQEAEELKTKYEKSEAQKLIEKKQSAVKEAAMKAGILPGALQDIDVFGFDGVIVESDDSGKTKVLGAEKYVEQLKQIRPFWFGGAATKINTGMPDVVSDKPVSESDLITLSLEAKKSGDYSAYQKAMARFSKQKQK